MTDETTIPAIQIRGRIAELQWTREPTPALLDRALRELVQRKNFQLGSGLLLVIRTIDFHPTKEQIEGFVKTLTLFAKHLDRHVAVVVESEFHYGTVRKIDSLAVSQGITLTPFREMGPAEQWLQAQLSDSQFLSVPPPMPPEQT
jgi:hypothetical protein